MSAPEAPSWLDRHAVKLVVILIATVIVVPAAMLWVYNARTSDTANEAKDTAALAAKTARVTQQIARENKTFNSRLSAVLTRNCQRDTNPQRRVFRELLEEQIRTAERLAPSTLPNLTPEQFHSLIQEGIEVKRRAINKEQPLKCATRYPVAGGSDQGQQAGR